MKDYIIERLCEKSTWEGIIASSLGITAYLDLKLAIYITAGLLILTGIIKIFTKEHAKTETKIDDIFFHAADAVQDTAKSVLKKKKQ